MAGGGGSTDVRSLEQTPTWAVATVCFVLIFISIFVEQIIHMIGNWFKKRRKKALYESLEKIKAKLMLLGFISLLLTVGTKPITKICISKSAASSWHPCSRKAGEAAPAAGDTHRRLLTWSKMGNNARRILANGGGQDNCADKVSSFNFQNDSDNPL